MWKLRVLAQVERLRYGLYKQQASKYYQLRTSHQFLIMDVVLLNEDEFK
jgi:hypothetical protein